MHISRQSSDRSNEVEMVYTWEKETIKNQNFRSKIRSRLCDSMKRGLAAKLWIHHNSIALRNTQHTTIILQAGVKITGNSSL